MQLIVDMAPVDGHQVEGHVSRADMRTPMAFCGWLDFVRVLETVLHAGDAPEHNPQKEAATLLGPQPLKVEHP